LGTELQAKTLFIIGLGATGIEVAKRGRSFGMHIIAVTKDPLDLIYAGEYLDIVGIPKTDYAKRLRIRRLICRVCKLKFRTRQETQEHIKHQHRRL
jgi:hypothetical protein